MRLDVASPSLFMGGRGTTHGGHTQTHAHRRHSKMCIASDLSVRAPLVGALGGHKTAPHGRAQGTAQRGRAQGTAHGRAQGTAPTFET